MKIFKFLLTACFLFYSTLGIEANEFEGIGAGASVTTGYYNMAIGQFALTSMTTGYRNVAAGERAGYSLTTGYGNVLLGAFAGYSLTTDVNKLYITNSPASAAGIFGDFATGYFGVNNTSPSVAWDITGALTVSGNVTAGGVLINSTALLIPDFAGIWVDGGGLITVELVDAFEHVTTFDTDMPEVVSDGDHSTDDITIGATGVYEIIFDASAEAAAVNKSFDFFVFEKETASSGTISGISQGNPGIVTTASAHGLSNGDRVIIEGVSGMTEVNGNMYTVAGTNTTTFQLNDDNSGTINTGGYGAWSSSSGTVTKATRLAQVHSHRKFGTNSDQGDFGGSSFVSVTAGKTLELWLKGTTDATNITVEACQFRIRRVQ